MTGGGWRVAVLRYFNPIGAHESGRLGEDARKPQANLLPAIARVAAGRQDRLAVYGSDYPSKDGTGVRDFIHVDDVASGHLAALKYLAKPEGEGLLTVNLGRGEGYSVLDVIRAFEAASGQSIAYELQGRREGDIGLCYADTSLAQERLGWQADRNLESMCADLWRWLASNPRGYGE